MAAVMFKSYQSVPVIFHLLLLPSNLGSNFSCNLDSNIVTFDSIKKKYEKEIQDSFLI